MRPSGKDGYIYGVDFEAQIEGDGTTPLPTGSFYIIIKKNEVGSALPLPERYVFHDSQGLIPETGEIVAPVSLEKLCFAKDTDESFSREVFEQTAQCDTATAYVPGRIPTIQGNLNGYFETDSEAQRRIMSNFEESVDDDGQGNIVLRPLSQEPLWMAETKRETTQTGEREITVFKPCIPTQMTRKKPMQGAQEFTIAYNVDGSLKPILYYRTIS